jgi:hypothetical protein
MAAVAPVAQDVVFQARGLTKVYHMGDADERAIPPPARRLGVPVLQSDPEPAREHVALVTAIAEHPTSSGVTCSSLTSIPSEITPPPVKIAMSSSSSECSGDQGGRMHHLVRTAFLSCPLHHLFRPARVSSR